MRLGLRKRHSISKVMLLPCLFVCICAVSVFILHRAEPTFKARCSDYSNRAFTELVNACIKDIAKTDDFKNFFEAVYDDNHRITSIEANPSTINTVKSTLVIDIQNALNADYPAYIDIPLGALSKYALLTSYGPNLHIKIIPISIVNCELEDEFEAVGINQVRHKLFMNVYVDMHYCGYTLDESERIYATIPLAETIYSADVPMYYGSGMAGEIAIN